MKPKILHFLFAAFFLLSNALATNAQGGTLPLNSSIAGTLTSSTPDVYSVTTTADGLLRLTFHTSGTADLYVTLYDNNGTTAVTGSVESYNNSTVYINADGLAKGTYYAKITPFGADYGSYTLADSFFTSPITVDAEPNGSRATALTLPLDGKKTGHVGYYYNNQRDSTDWYKVTTNADGLLRLNIILARSSTTYSSNSLDVYVTLFDNDGTTQLGKIEAYNYKNGGGGPDTSLMYVDGLAAGTYYVSIQPFNSSQFDNYILSDSLFTSPISNDQEPNGTKSTALNLPQNGGKTGHVGYYYNNQRDTADWYKVTTTADGLLRVNMITARSSIYSNNTLDVNVTLYDIDGSTQLGKVEAYNYTIAGNPDTIALNVDRLAAGTYYVAIQNFSNGEFANYKLSDTLLTYNINDNEPDDYPYQATTIPANGVVTGHVGFYFNGGVKQDYSDWFRINYTGSGSLQFTFNLLPHLGNGALGDVFFQVYKDTAASPVFNQEFYLSATNTFTLSSLSQGYYWIKILPYNSSPNYFTAYSISNSFTQVAKARIKVVSYDTAGNCASSNNIIFHCSGSHAPYRVQLYRFGIAYGNAVTTNAANKAVFNNLPDGSYYATAYGDGATGTAFGKSAVNDIIPSPTNAHTTAIQSKQATLNWTGITCADYYAIEYRVHGTTVWSNKKISGNVNSYVLKGLTASTSYDWAVAAVDSSNGISATSAYTDSVIFTTSASLIGANDQQRSVLKNNNGSASEISVYPNPASSELHIKLGNVDLNKEGKIFLTLKNMSGGTVWSTENTNSLQTVNVDVSKLAAGFYILQIINADGSSSVHKIVITK